MAPAEAPAEPQDGREAASNEEAGAPGRPSVAELVREHPGLAIAGGIAAGLLAGALLHRGTRRRLLRGGTKLAGIAAAKGLALAREAIETAEDTGSDLRERGEAMAGKAGALGRSAGDRLGVMLTPAEQAAVRTVRLVGNRAAALRKRLIG